MGYSDYFVDDDDDDDVVDDDEDDDDDDDDDDLVHVLGGVGSLSPDDDVVTQKK